MGCDVERGCQRGSHILVYLLTARKLLLREGFEAAFGPDRMGEKGGCS